LFGENVAIGMSVPEHDIIVVGSGLAGAHACKTLVDAGANVLLLDAGITGPKSGNRFPDLDFESIRRQVSDQRRLFLGDDFEGIPWGALKAGAQLTPQRQYVMRGVEHWLKLASDNFHPFESLAFGGLGNAWGAGCYLFSDEEFRKMGFDRQLFMDGYQTVADRIGISAADDDAAPFMVKGLNGIMPALRPEPRMEALLNKYDNRREQLNRKGFFMGRPALAAITEDRRGRKAFDYADMEFWHDQQRSVYRPWMTIDDLNERPGFQKLLGKLATSFEETEEGVNLTVLDMNNGTRETYRAKRLMLCPGVLGTARLVMRSLPNAERLPILCNPYSYVPMLDWRQMGRSMPARRSGMGQLVMFHDPDGRNADVAMAAMFSYRSLMLFRLVKEAPLNLSDGRALMQYLLSGITISGIHHPESGGDDRFLTMESDATTPTGDRMRATYRLSKEEKEGIRVREGRFFQAFRSLGQWPLRKVDPGMGSSIHYAGALPVSRQERPFSTSEEGRLHGTRSVWVGDASSFRYLPAKGISFTIMANAHRVARNLLAAQSYI
jgi:hypothetical protein